jgi:hypothetical protein
MRAELVRPLMPPIAPLTPLMPLPTLMQPAGSVLIPPAARLLGESWKAAALGSRREPRAGGEARGAAPAACGMEDQPSSSLAWGGGWRERLSDQSRLARRTTHW